MPQRIVEFLGGVPFLVGVADSRGPVKLNWSRVIEALVIAAIAGLLAGYIAVQKLTVQVDTINQKVDKVEQRVYEHIIQSGGQ